MTLAYVINPFGPSAGRFFTLFLFFGINEFDHSQATSKHGM